MPKKKSEVASEFIPTMSKEEASIRMTEAQVRLTEAKAMSELAKVRNAQIDFDKQCGTLVYAETAIQEFNRALAPLMGSLKSFSQTLVMEARLSPEQHSVVNRLIQGIFEELSQIDFQFETAREVDERAKQQHTNKESAIAKRRKVKA